MKNTKLMTVLGLSLISTVALVAVSQEVDAVESTTTQGRVSFKEPGNPTDPDGPFALIKPGTYDEWITIKKDEGKQTLDGKFRFSFVPNFDFGTVEVSSTDSYHNLQHSIPYQSYDPVTDKKMFDETDTSRDIKYLPPFLQVVNLRGTNQEYKVSVKAGKFIGSKSGQPTGGELENTSIQIKDFLTRNNVLNQNNLNGSADSILEGPKAAMLNAQGYLNLRSDTDLLIMNTKKGEEKKTDGSASSLVFQKDYDLGKDYPADVIKTSDSVRLFVPASDTPTIGVNYTADVTWTLEDTI